MSAYTIKIHSQGLEDIRLATLWYNEQSAGLGNRFQSQVIKQITKLKTTAELYALRYDQIHCLVIHKFPFMVHYSLDTEKKEIVVYAVFHTSLNPQIWKKRK